MSLSRTALSMAGFGLAVMLWQATALAQAPAPAPAQPAPATPSAPPAPAPAAPPATTPAAPPAATPAPPPEAKTGEPFGQEVAMAEKTIVYMTGSATWDTAFDTIVDSLKSVYALLKKESITPTGAPMVIYTSTDDTGFQFQAAVPVAQGPANLPPGDIATGKSPGGKALKFVHHGSYDEMDSTYEAITNFLDEKNLEAKDLFIEEYATDPLTTAEEKLVIDVYVPLK
jgi:effector-binding domain-containing protein